MKDQIEISLQLKMKQAEEDIIVAINKNITEGLPCYIMSYILDRVKLSIEKKELTEYQIAVAQYNEAIKAKAEKENEKNAEKK